MAGLLTVCYVLVFSLAPLCSPSVMWRRCGSRRKKGFVTGRSRCPGCGKELKWYHTVPVLNYLFLRGKCAYCKQRDFTAVPVMGTAGRGIACLTFFFSAAACSSLTALSFFRFLLLFAFFRCAWRGGADRWGYHGNLNGPILILAGLGLVSIFLFPKPGLSSGASALSASACRSCCWLLSEGAFGGGDIKLMAACGLFLGWKLNLTALFFALLVGGRLGLAAADKTQGQKDQLAFGPFLCAGVAASALFGQQALDWYLKFFTMALVRAKGRCWRMPNYKYTAAGSNGKKVRGVMTARMRLRFTSGCGRRKVPHRQQRGDGKADLRQIENRGGGGFCRQLGTLLGAGVSLVRALSIIAAEESVKPKVRTIYEEMLRLIRQGVPLSGGHGAPGPAFPELLVGMLRSAEVSGNLDHTAKRMAVHYEKGTPHQFQGAQRHGIPIILAVMMVAIVVFVVGYTCPILRPVCDYGRAPLDDPGGDGFFRPGYQLLVSVDSGPCRTCDADPHGAEGACCPAGF